MELSAATVLGPFALTAQVGEGATSVVWSAVHVVTSIPAALKVLKPGMVLDIRHRDALRYEVRAVASLDHPSIVTVLDQGDLVSGGAPHTHGGLPGGSPWVAMEFLRGGTLSPWCGKLPWPAVCSILGALLGALGHAHARGVIHRDVKPGNVLLDDQGAPRLADFGIAAVLHDRPFIGAGSGTPGFMAPEQRIGRLRDLGPWTDLYAVGRLALALVTGRPEGGTAGSPAPDGFREWVAKLVAPEPADRYGRAADAAASLASLGPARGQPVEPGHPEVMDTGTPTWVEDEGTDEAPHPAPVDPRIASRLSVSEDWRSELSRRPPPPPALRLYGLRPAPFAGRLAVRDTLWAELREVHDSGVARVVVLRGPAGVGKTRLATWLCERAHETGAGEVLVATHDTNGGTDHGLGPMVARFLRCGLLSGTVLAEFLQQRLTAAGLDDPWDREVLTGLLGAGVGPPAGPTERYAVLRRFLATVAGPRTAVVRVEDAHLGPDALGLASTVAAAPTGCRALLVITARDEALASNPIARDRLLALAALPGVRVIDVPPLDEEERRELVRGLLGLEPTLAARVEERTAGNPAFAVTLVGDWVERDLLVPGRLGLELVPGAVLDLPDDLLQVWETRVTGFLAGRPRSDAAALEIAALLGVRVDREEWSAACNEAGAPLRADLADALVEQGLATSRPDEAAWSFVHGMLREAVARRGRRRSARFHRACAAALSARAGDVERVGLHLAAAGEHVRAVGPLTRAAYERSDRGEDRMAEWLVSRAVSALEAADIARDDPRWAPVLRRRGKIRGNLGKLDDALADLVPAEGLYSEHDRDRWIQTRVDRARIHRMAGHLVEAERLLGSVAEQVSGSGPEVRAAWHGTRAVVLCDQGRLVEAEAELRAGLRIVDDPRELPRLIGIVRRSGRLDEAFELLATADALARRSGNRMVAAMCANERGELERARGDLAAAEAAYLASAALVRASGRSDGWIVLLNVAIVRILDGRAKEAEDELRELVRRFDEVGRVAFAAAARTGLLVCDVAARDWEAWDLGLRSVKATLETTTWFDADLARLAECAGKAAELAGEGARAADAFDLAVVQWRGVGNETEAERVRARRGDDPPDRRRAAPGGTA